MNSIRAGAELCLDHFHKSCGFSTEATLYERAGFVAVKNQSDRFKIWTSNIGVFADLHASLDFRVRDHDDVKDNFLGHLKIIEYRLRHRMLSLLLIQGPLNRTGTNLFPLL
jgi:hypothetical protein